jgi:hypothetical protein
VLSRLGVEDVVEVVRRGRLLWLGHVERKSQDDWVKMCRDLVVEGTRRKGWGRKTWQECVNEDMKRIGLRRCDAQDHIMWRNSVLRNAQPALALKNGH